MPVGINIAGCPLVTIGRDEQDKNTHPPRFFGRQMDA
jgi:hypothetical protein